MNDINGFEVDMYGSAAIVNDDGLTAQIAFGMDNDYRCELEVWGSKATLRTGRVLTAPVGFEPKLTISRNGKIEERILKPDDAFEKSILHFKECIGDSAARQCNYEILEKQAALVDEFFRKAQV